MLFTEAESLFQEDTHRVEVAQRLYFYLMREPTQEEVNRYLEIEIRAGNYGEAAVIGTWVREQTQAQKLRTTEVHIVAAAIVAAHRKYPEQKAS